MKPSLITLANENRRRAGVRVLASLVLPGLASFLLTGCGGKGQPPSSASATTVPEGPARLVRFGQEEVLELDPRSIQLAHVKTAVAGAEDLRQIVQPTGQVTASDADTVQVTSRLPGRIVEALVSVGQLVRQGQLLATVDSVDLTQAEATYQTAVEHEQLAYNQLQQQRKLAGYGALSEQPVEDARRAYAAAQAAVKSDEAQIAIDRTTLLNTEQLVQMGEITRKPVEDAQNAYAQAQAALQQAKVNLQSTKANLDRARVLFNGGIFAKQQLEDAETAYNNAVAAQQQAQVQEGLAAQELQRQQSIFQKNLNGASSVQAAQSKLQQDQHTYQNDLTGQELSRKELIRAQIVRRSGIPISQALQQAEDAYHEAQVARASAANTLRLYGVTPGQGVAQLANGHALVPVYAPVSGVIVSRNMAVGQMTDTSTPLVKVDNLNQVYVDAQVYENDLTDVAVGDPVQIQVSAYPGRVFTGRVQSIGAEVSPDTRTVTVRTVIDNPGWLLRPGMFASIRIGSRSPVHTLAVPASAVIQEGSQNVVYVEVASGKFSRRSVQVGQTMNGFVPVLSGLVSGEQVVTGGNVLLENAQEKLEEGKGTAV